MPPFAAPELDDEESERDLRLRLILLFVALLLVAGYAATMTEIGAAVPSWLVAVADSKPSIMASVGVGIVGCVITAAFLIRRRRAATHNSIERQGDGRALLPRRQQMIDALGEQLATHAKNGRQLALHLIDIDRFARLNAILGEAEGDAFLGLVRERLLVLVGNEDRLARIGDDEFAIIQPEAGGARHAEIYAKRIQEKLKDACAQVPRHARPGASVGVAVSGDQGGDAVKLMRSAGVALRAAKAAGGETFRVYTRDMEMATTTQLQAEHSISEGLHQGWFEMHFQPQYHLRSRRLTGFEALVRMNHPELGEQLPAAFLPAAEVSGLIQPLGEWIIREALEIARLWPPHLTLSLNIALAQFRHGDAAGTILSALSRSGFEASRLQLEISEAVIFEESAAIDAQMQRLRGRGVSIVVDDFGLDHSKLRALSRSACHAIKLDRTLVERVGEEAEIEGLMRSLMGTARAFGLGILAEGVERAEQVHFLMSNACENVQGFLFGRPAHAHELAAIIAKDMRNAIGADAAAPLVTAIA